ncbi:hypothetical protein TDB9533_03254 [Thalassocella blandensis]|nr:hypothetical protein TDB9533_03254 [Thalassocella blandensis]
MLIKILIVIEFIVLLVCLASSFTFLVKDIGVSESKRVLYALGIRITFAALLLGTVAYGIQTGKLTNQAPWGHHWQAAPTSEN